MKNYWKQLEGWGIGLKTNMFLQARLKLTAYYIILITIILSVFSVVLYYALLNNLQDVSDYPENSQMQIAAVNKTVDSLENTIILIDLTVLLLISFLSWFLAGGTLKPIKKSLEAQKQFSANASHELRTPLAIMRTDSEVTLRSSKSNPEDLKRLAVNNLEEIKKMSRIVEDLLILSRSENLSVDAVRQFNLSDLISGVVEKIKILAKVKNIIITLDKADKISILGQADAIERMILNILQNAINYTPDFGKIELSLKDQDKFAELTVTDNGVGIAATDLPHIFERFYKADKSRRGEANSSGLGLSIVKEIIDSHRGNIMIKSDVGLGTTVIVKLPKNRK
ncbi:MAG: sensor histidine kinase [Patescibacteria group bacterium]